VHIIIIATRNDHKVQEIGTMLGSSCRCLSLKEFKGAPPVIEDAPTFEGNAIKKSTSIARWLGSNTAVREGYVLADDSGLEVDALNGSPGIHSARFAALDSGEPGNSSDAENNAKLLKLLAETSLEKRTARFRCVLALCPVLAPEPESSSPVCFADYFETATEVFQGACEGHIAFSPSGKGGFGYDPLFIPEGYTESFAELGEAVKNRLSHRAKALEKLKQRLSMPQ
jgi:XTP/dITP diphosphohydrolase